MRRQTAEAPRPEDYDGFLRRKAQTGVSRKTAEQSGTDSVALCDLTGKRRGV